MRNCAQHVFEIACLATRGSNVMLVYRGAYNGFSDRPTPRSKIIAGAKMLSIREPAPLY